MIGSNRVMPEPIDGGFIACPFGDYTARFWDPRAVLSVLADMRDKTASEQVDYTRAQVSVRRQRGPEPEVGRVPAVRRRRSAAGRHL